MLRRQNLNVPPDTPSCCAAQVEKMKDILQSETHISGMPDDSSGFMGHFDVGMDSVFDGLMDTDRENPDFDSSYSPSGPENEVLFERPAAETQSHTMTPENMNYDFSLLDPREGSAVTVASGQSSSSNHVSANLSHEAFVFDTQNATATCSLSYPQTHPSGRSHTPHNRDLSASQILQREGQQTGNAFGWLSVFDPIPEQYNRQDNDTGGTSTPSPSVVSNIQTTIRLEDADPSTVSAVIGVLMESKAKFKFETH